MKPNFLFLGPDKVGSSWLFRILRNHPQCFVPACKDIYYFDRFYDNGTEWYESFFEECPSDAIAIGELSHDYLFSDKAASRIATDLKDVRLLTILRHPVDRTWSQYLYMMRNGYSAASFRDALERYPFLISNSLYAGHLVRYQEFFDAGRLGIFWFDDLVDSPAEFANEIIGFLGLDTEQIELMETKDRSAAKARNKLVASIVKKCSIVLRKIGGARIVGAIKHSPIVSLLYRPYEDGEKPVISDEDRGKLLREFLPDVEKLEKMLDIELPSWKS